MDHNELVGIIGESQN